MLNILALPVPERVELAAVDLSVVGADGEVVLERKFDFAFDCLPISTRLGRMVERGEKFDLHAELPEAAVADLVSAWESEALRDLETGDMSPCNRENVLEFMDRVPDGWTILTTALLEGYVNRLKRKLKNLKALSDTPGATVKATAKDAESLSE